MGKQHTDYFSNLDEDKIDDEIKSMQVAVEARYGIAFNSTHELYAVLLEELDEFWDSVKQNDPDPAELMDIIVTARMGLIWMCKQSKDWAILNKTTGGQ